MLLQVSFLLISHFVWAASALQCLNCDHTFNLSLPTTINIAQLQCPLADGEYSSCSQLLHVRYSEKKAVASFKAGSSLPLMLPNVARKMTNTTKIWLDEPMLDRTFEIFCFDPQSCTPRVINDIYMQVPQFKYSELWAQLVIRLYETVVGPDKLICADNQDKPIQCPNGFCQLISYDSNSFSRSCVMNNSIPDRYGALLKSETMSETEIQSTLTYTCNKNMCNNVATAKAVRLLLEERNVLPFTTTTTTTTTPKPMATTTNTAGNTVKPSIIIQYSLVLLIPICLNFKLSF